jgi:hypothetical protein
MVGWLNNDDVERIWKEVALIKVLSQDLPGAIKDRTKALVQDSWGPSQGSNWAPTE